MKYMFGGFIEVAGKLDNGKPWFGFRILLAPLDKDGHVGWKTSVVKASRTDDLFDTLCGMELHSIVTAYFNEDGRLVDIKPVPWAKEVN